MKCMSTLIGLLGACGLTALSATAATTGSAATTSSGDQAWVQLWENGPKWATCNLGASAPEETGKYFWWGDTVGYTPVNGRFTGINFEAGEDPASSTRKKTQAELIAGGWLDASTHLLSDAHDAAKAQWGGDWRMPTHMELDGLLSKCDSVWTTQGGVNGLLVTGRGAFAGNSIFLPAAGYGDSFGQLSCVSSTGGYGMYWSSSQFADALPSGASPVAFASYGSWRLYFGSQAIKLTSPIETRHLGLTIRPVCGAATVVPPVPPTTVDDQPDCVQLWENGPYWATRNVGATKPSDPGLYFMWSETVGHTKSESSAFTSANCPAYGKDEAELRAAGILQDDSYCLAPQYDAAFQHLGEGWRMPSFTLDIKLLQLNCTWTSTTQDGVAGFLITGKGDYADRSIFWPNAGHIDSYRNFVDRCCYWSGSVYDGSTNARHTLNGGGEFNALRYCGMPVRAIRDTPPEAPPAVTPTEGSLVVDTTVSDHCVLQRGVVNKVKGTATPGATVKVTFGGVSATAVAGANGDFVVSFNPGAANATGRDLVVSDTVNTITISDVLVGDVFYLSGQSNVRFEVEAYNKNEALADCDYPNFRMMVMPSADSVRIVETDKDLPCSWIASSSTTCTAMSSFGFFLGRELIKSKNVPIGIVSAAVKGTDIASWLPNGGCDKYMASRCDHIAVKGAIWYQGESDALNYSDRAYPQKLKNLIQYWRTNRGNSNLPVVVVQLPRYRDTYKNCGDTEKINCWGIFRVDQDLAIAEVDNAVCVPTLDYGAEYNIHPSDKHLMGARIALAVRSLMYGDAVAYRCPYPTGAVKSEDGSSVTVSFPSSTVLSFSSDTASESFGAESDMFSVGGVHVKPTISADGHSLVFSGSFADATSVDYALCGFPQILVRDANGFPMPPFSLALSSGGEDPVDPTDEPTQMFYIGETGYDSFADVMVAAKNGDTIKVGKNATFSISALGGKSITFDLCGRTLTWESGGYVTSGSITVIDSDAPAGRFEFASGNRNYQTLVDMSALTKDQLTGSGKFWSGATTKVVFPADMPFDSALKFMDNKVSGEQIVVQGVTYTYDGSTWISDSPAATYSITITAPQNGTLETSVTNDVTAGTTVTVTAKAATGYQLKSVTMNGAAITGNTFVMPAADATLAATFEKQSTPPVDPPEEPAGESDRQWTAEDYDPAAWTPLANNIFAGLTATAGGTGNLAYDAKDVTKLTDGKVSATADKSEVAGLCPGAELVWTFAEPQTLEKIRVSSLMNPEGNGKLFAGISVADILVQRSGSSDWVSLGVSFSRSGSATAGGAQYATLSDPVLGYLAVDVTAVKFVQGKVEAFGNYYSEMEAVGRKSSDSPTYPPAMSGFKVRPWGESAEFSGTVVSLGSGATSCDVYLACGADADHLGAPVKIYTGNAGAFHYELEGLSQSTGYAYSLAVSNNAATVASCAVSGEFTTTAEVHPDWSAYKWAVIGDSLTDPTLNPYAGNFYYNFVARDTGIQLVYTNGVGSTGYKNRQNENRCFYQRLLTDPLPSDVDVVTIFGSVNDWGQVRNAADAGSPSDRIEDGKTTLAAYMNKAIDVVQAQAPGAKLILAGSLYYYNVVGEAHARANETLRAVAEARGIPFYDWLTEDPNDPLDFHHIADDPTAEGSFAKRYARDCPSTIVPGETMFGHPSAEYHEAWLSPHFRGILTTAIASVKPVTLGEPVARPLTDYNGNTVSIAFTGDIPDGAEVSAKVTIGGADYAGEIGEGVVTFEIPSDAVTSGNVYAGKITVTVGGVDYTKDVTLEQGTFKVDEEAEWIAESAASFESSGAWSGDKAEVSGGVIAVSNALFTAAKAAPEDAVVTITSTFGFNNASDEDFNSDAQAGVKVVKVGGVNRYAFLTGDGVVTNLTAAADVAHSVAVKVTIDKNADTVVYELGGTEFGPFAAVDGKDAVSKVRYTGATEVASLDGSYRVEFLDTNLASAGGAEYATVADALAAGEAGAVQLLWDASWTPSAIGDYNIATNGHFLAIGGELAYQVKDNGDGTVTVTVTGGETPDTPVAGSITLSGGEVKVAVANAQSDFWYTLAKTTDLAESFEIARDAKWVAGADLLAGAGELTIALGEGETAAFYRVVVSETAPTLK